MDVLLLCMLCCVGSGLLDELITWSDDFDRVCASDCVGTGYLKNKAAWALLGLLRY